MPILITQEARQMAEQFARQQPEARKAEQVRLNTLAIYTVHQYCRILGIPSDPSNCDSWNPLMRMTTNVADLEVVGRGRIECRPVSGLGGILNSVCYVPTEVQSDRIAYVVVQLESETSEALILGFVEQVDQETLPLSRLRPMTEFPLYLESPQSAVAHPMTQLSRWLWGQIEADWQPLEALLGMTPLNYQWRSASPEVESSTPSLSRVIRGKVLEIPGISDLEPMVLIAELIPKAETDLGIELKVTPIREQSFLPAGLEVFIVDALGQTVMQAQARDQNRTIELGFHAEPGDRFSLEIVLGEGRIREAFVV